MLLIFLFSFSISKRYQKGAEVVVYANVVSPYNNPFETYNYYTLPFCRPSSTVQPTKQSIADSFLGNNLQNTGVVLNFQHNIFDSTICKISLDENDNLKKFQNAIRNKFYYQLFIDKLPVWGFVGAKSNANLLIFTRQHFIVHYNNDRIIAVSMNTEVPFTVEPNRIVKFTYSVEWVPTNHTKEVRFSNYNNTNNFFNPNSNIFVFNTFLFVIFFVVVTAFVIIRSVGRDFSQFQKESEINDFDINFHSERGWKMIHADVFRQPTKYGFFSILIGIGSQLFTSFLIYLLIAVLFGSKIGRNGSFYIAIFSYILASFVGGYFSSGLFKRWGGSNWIGQLLLMVFSIPFFFLLSESVLLLVSIAYRTSRTIKVVPYLYLMCILIFLIFPTTIFGGIIGRHWFLIGQNPTRVGMIRRTIPLTPFYLRTWFLSLFIGFVSFASIFVEVTQILKAIVQFRIYTVWLFSLIILFLLFCVVSCSAIVAVYLRLSAENYEWHWVSFMAPFSISYYVFLYSVYYFISRTQMTGIIQTLYYFLYTAVLSNVVGIVCGFVGFSMSALFVRRIYTNIKTD